VTDDKESAVSDIRKAIPMALAVGIGGFLLAVPGISTRPLWFDESFDGVAVRQSWHGLVSLISETEASQTLWLVVLKPWAEIAPSIDWWLRLPAVLFGAGAGALLVVVGAQCLDRWTGVVAGAFFVTNAFVISWMQQARTYTLAALAAVLTTLLFLRALDRHTTWPWALYGISMGLAVYAHFYLAFMAVVHAVAMLSAPRPPRVSHALLSWLIAASIAAPAVWFATTADRGQLSWIPDPRGELVWRSLYWNSGWSIPALVAAGVGALVLIRRSLAAQWWPAPLLIGWATLPTLLGLVVSRHIRPILTPQYAIVSAPALALLAAVAVTSIGWRRRWGAALAVAVVVGFAAYERFERSTEEVTADWRDAAAFLEKEAKPQDNVVVLPTWVQPAMEFYAPGLPYRTTVDRHARRAFVTVGCDDAEGLLAATVRDLSLVQLGTPAAFGSDLCVYTYLPRKEG
jgi:mannosyltransferase